MCRRVAAEVAQRPVSRSHVSSPTGRALGSRAPNGRARVSGLAGPFPVGGGRGPYGRRGRTQRRAAAPERSSRFRSAPSTGRRRIASSSHGLGDVGVYDVCSRTRLSTFRESNQSGTQEGGVRDNSLSSPTIVELEIKSLLKQINVVEKNLFIYTNSFFRNDFEECILIYFTRFQKSLQKKKKKKATLSKNKPR